MKVIPDFLNELKAINPDIEIVVNPHRRPNEENRIGISNIKLWGQDICPIPDEDIFDEPNDTYGYIFPNAVRVSRFRTRPEAIGMVQHVLEQVKTKDGKDAFEGKGEFDTRITKK